VAYVFTFVNVNMLHSLSMSLLGVEQLFDMDPLTSSKHMYNVYNQIQIIIVGIVSKTKLHNIMRTYM